jgi:hypothetical protein
LKDLITHSKVEHNGRRNWGMFPNSQHFGGKRSVFELCDGITNDKPVNYSYEFVKTKQQVG